jgi:BirA family transcriptional regulator, biotin operon repressor / biotin---[acetyl-CoA-carboxylase] ligase
VTLPRDISEEVVTQVLLALWAGPAASMRELALRVSLSEAVTGEALSVLQTRQCLIEETPQGLELLQTGLSCWRDVLEARPAGKLGARAIVFQKTASTNDACWEHAADPAAHGLVVLADEQSEGRGRRGSAWVARPGQSILMSILLRQLPSGNLDALTLLLGLATAQAIEHTAASDTAIKWPNDVLVQDRKVAGVLVEARPAGGDQYHVVLGIGLNVTQSTADFPDMLRQRATSLYQATGRSIDRLRVIAALLERIESLYLHPVPVEQWLHAWKARCPALGKPVTAQTPAGVFTGQLLDIDPFHGLVLLDEAGARHFLSARTTTLMAWS